MACFISNKIQHNYLCHVLVCYKMSYFVPRATLVSWHVHIGLFTLSVFSSTPYLLASEIVRY